MLEAQQLQMQVHAYVPELHLLWRRNRSTRKSDLTFLISFLSLFLSLLFLLFHHFVLPESPLINDVETRVNLAAAANLCPNDANGPALQSRLSKVQRSTFGQAPLFFRFYTLPERRHISFFNKTPPLGYQLSFF